ncbi:MAG: VOC family protein [bacterium]|nr:VOC family protein [bacterium]
MSPSVQPIPDGFHGVTPYLCVNGASSAIDFYQRAFGAVETMRIGAPGGKVGHAELRIGEAPIFLADEFPEMDVLSPSTIGGSPVTIFLYVEDVDALVSKAESAGAEIVTPPETKFYGDRGAKLRDPFGHVWYFATHVEDVSPEEIERRSKAMQGG